MQLRQAVLNFGQHSEMFLPTLEVDQTLLWKLQVLHSRGSGRTIQPNDIFKKLVFFKTKILNVDWYSHIIKTENKWVDSLDMGLLPKIMLTNCISPCLQYLKEHFFSSLMGLFYVVRQMTARGKSHITWRKHIIFSLFFKAKTFGPH